MGEFLDSIDISVEPGLRDRAIFELMYSSGLRISEVWKLNVSDMDFAQRILKVVEGKGSKDRFVPFSKVAGYFAKRYIDSDRRRLVKRVKADFRDAFFLTVNGRIIRKNVKKRFDKILEMMDNLKRTYRSYHPRENMYSDEIDRKYLGEISSLKEEIVRTKEKNKLRYGG